MNWSKRKPTANELVPREPVVGTSGSLREFVYLDEVSVYSLTSAPDLPPPVTMSESATTGSGEVFTGQLEAGGPVLAKASLGSELNSSRTGGKEVQRQFNIQSQFARLHGMYSPTFLVDADTNAMPRKSRGRTEDLARALEELEENRRAVREADLTRGALAEMRVALRPHHMFDITAFTKTAGNLIRKYPALLGVHDLSEVANGLEAGEFFAELMEDLVPIEGRATTYRVLNDQLGDRWIVDISTLKVVYTGVVTSEPLRVVGVAESGAFWKDTRRILHSDSDFDLLGRVARTGLQTEWTSVKVIDTFRRVAPSVADGFLEAVDLMRNVARVERSSSDPGSVLLLAGMAFHQELASHHDVTTAGPSLATMVTLVGVDGDLRETLTALNRIAAEFYCHNPTLERDPDAVAAMRQHSWRSAQALSGVSNELPESEALATTPDPPAVELEFIAMYW